jgi:diacylglycerol kinase (ATP)
MALKLLMNDKAGRLHRTPNVHEMRETLRVLGLEAEVVGTGSEPELRRKVRGLVEAGEERIAIAGGDGTVRLAVEELAGTQTALAIVPQGTMNNFATALRLPLSLPMALRAACEGEIREIDLGRACGKLFTESAGVGLFANALSIYGRHNKSLWRGLVAVSRTLLDFRPSRIAIDVDDQRWEERAAWVVAANGFRMAQALPVAPSASLTDGLLDLVVLGDLARNELIPYYLAIRRQTHLTLPKTRFCTGKCIELHTRRTMPVHIDDRIGGNTPARIEVMPNHLKVVVERL